MENTSPVAPLAQRDPLPNIVGELFTRHEVCRILRVSLRTLTRWVSEGDIAYARLGNAKNSPIRIPRSELVRLYVERETDRLPRRVSAERVREAVVRAEDALVDLRSIVDSRPEVVTP